MIPTDSIESFGNESVRPLETEVRVSVVGFSVIRVTLLVAILSAVGCSPMRFPPSRALLPTWAVLGQSNAAALAGNNQTIDPPGREYLAPYANVVGSWRGGMPIAAWDEGQLLWKQFAGAASTAVSGLIIWEGEQDQINDDNVNCYPEVCAPEPAGYFAAHLTRIIAAARTMTGRATLPVFVVELGPMTRGRAVTQETLSVIAHVGHAAYVPTVDLPFRDGVHMDPVGYQAVAAWLAQMMAIIR